MMGTAKNLNVFSLPLITLPAMCTVDWTMEEL